MTLEERLAECCGEVELLTAVMDLVDCPEDCHLVTGSVEPVVATVQSQGRGHPGGGGVPGQVSEAVVLVDVDIEAEQGGLGDQATRSHEEASGYAGHTVSSITVIFISKLLGLYCRPVSNVVLLTNPDVDQSLRGKYQFSKEIIFVP